ncbi:hypothetical protein LTR37_013191 [Vermiconidia calcicola]|uniref:Uncharacterized protein n=1 Tax=Vermiconidia calcicola TaxID=1690605 RepID=A0ACC3MYC7_9PEZI|nr:hypothetical protein LTR37_013191 [Vermiconidia calcicola]
MSLYPGVALITGAASGIGQATAVSFAREGCKQVAITDLDEAGLDETARLIKDAAPQDDVQILQKRTNVAAEDEVTGLLDAVVEQYGRIDYAANCAGIMSNNQRSDETSIADFDRINGVNYRGCWMTSRAELKQMLKQEPLPTYVNGNLAQRWKAD